MGGKVGCMITHGPWVFIGIPKSVEVISCSWILVGVHIHFVLYIWWCYIEGLLWLVQGMEHTDRNEINSSGAFWSGLFHDYHGWDGVCWYGRRSHHGLEISYYGEQHGTSVDPHRPWTSSRFTFYLSNETLLWLTWQDHQSAYINSKISLALTTEPYWCILCIYQVWDLMTLQCVQTLSEHKAPVTSVLCWDDKLLSCSLDKTVKLWTHSESGNLQVKYTHVEEHVSIAVLLLMSHFCFVECCRLFML